MKISTDLFYLIKSLSPSEKRYFKLFSAGRSSKGIQTYMLIFEEMDKMDEYDEKLLLARLNDEKLTKQFPVMKNYLYRLLMKSLRNFHAEQSVDFQIKELLLNVELLSDRGMAAQALKQLSKAERLAREYERYIYLTEIGAIRIGLNIRLGKGKLGEVETDILKIFSETKANFDRYQRTEQYRILSLRLLLLNRQEAVIRGDQTRRKYADLIAEDELSGEAPEFSKKALLFYYQSHFIYQVANGDLEQSFHFGSLMVELMETNAWMIAERPDNYIAALQNLVVTAGYAEPIAVVQELLEKLRTTQKRFPKAKFSPGVIRNLPMVSVHLELETYTQRGEYEQASRKLSEARKIVEASDPNMTINEGFLRMGIFLQFIYIYLHQKRLEDALYYCEEILSSEILSEEYEVHLNARILRVVILFEMQAEGRLESATMSLYRFLKRKERLYDSEKALFEFIRRSSRKPQSLPEEMQILKAELIRIKDKEGRYSSMVGFNLIAWLEERIRELSTAY